MITQISLRPWTADDAPVLQALANNAAIARNLTDSFPHPYGPENADNFIRFATETQPVKIMAIVCNGEVAGSIGLHSQADIMCKNMELGYWIGEPFWGMGIATEAVKQMVPYGFTNFNISRIFARPFGRNLASQRVLEKAGFVLEARLAATIYKLGEFEDELIYAVRRNGNP